MKEKIIVHVCCGICAIKTFEFLDENFEPAGYWYNPNIHPFEEYKKRFLTAGYVFQKIDKNIEWNMSYDIIQWFTRCLPVAGNKKTRCAMCYQMRLEKTAQFAKKTGVKIFTTTMFYSTHQDIETIKNTGIEIAQKYGINFLSLDIRQHYQKGQEIARNWKLYRQRYCGCLFSELEREGLDYGSTEGK
ncbi:MAG TPA: epoxyqueuosine reductase QueH [bacterium]|nr:epoxyqueuosine reductase QueH [bacterium]HOL35345.1 epoxyqueuosine reductase QueH [bacterium]HPP08528.1 epoxyqueuosine reductase QueH [bacterium]